MPAADAAWLHMDRAANPMVVNALVWFDEPLDWEGTREVFRQRIVARFPRFRQRVTEPLGRPAFEDGPQFDSTGTCTGSPCRPRATRPPSRS